MELDFARTPVFQGSTVPADCRLAGWAALAQVLRIAAPVKAPSCVSSRQTGLRRSEVVRSFAVNAR